jgi:hypothetical protein
MGEVETAAPSHQEFAPRRRHFLEDIHAKPRRGQIFRSDQTGRPGPDNGYALRGGHGLS